MKTLCLALALCACLTASFAAGATAGFPVVRGGQAKCQIVLGKDALAVEKQAAADLARCLKLMTSVEVPLVDEGKEKAGLPKIMVGPCALPADVMKRVNDRDYGGYIITQVGPDLILRGPSEFGSANAVYGLLEDTLGCHWFMPSELFEYVPKRAEVVLPALDVATNPGFRFRYFSGVTEGGPWQYRNRLDQPGNPNAPFLAQGHILYAIYPPSQYGKTHPEYFPLLGGKRRVPTEDSDQYANPCTSNPEVVQVAVDKINKFFDDRPKASTHSLCINDTNIWCQCEKCKALDVPLPVWRGREIYSDRYYTYANAVARGVAAKHPNQFIGVFAYWGVEPTPVKIPRLEPNMYVGITQDCAQHFDPAYRQTDYDFITQWQKKAAHVGKYDYFGLGAIVPRYYPHLIAQDIKHSKAVGLEGYHSEAYPLWPSFGPHIYIAARMLYNPALDVDKLLGEYFTDLYGPAAPEMAAFYQTMEDAWRRYKRPGQWFEGISSMSQQISMYKAEDLAAMRKHLRQAAQLADTDLVKQRVAYVQKGTEYGLNLIEGWLAAEKLSTMTIMPETAEETARLIKQVNRCVELSPRLWQSSIIDDPLAIGWYKDGARANVIAQWSSHCQDGVIQATIALGNCLDPSDSKLAGLLSRLQGTDAETIMKVSRGELDNAPNLLPNGSFESTEGVKGQGPSGPGWVSEGAPPGWGTWKIDPAKGKFYLDAGKVHGGKMAGAIEGGECLCYITTVPVEAGRRYAASAWVMAEKATATRKTTLEIRWQDAKGAWFGGGLNTATAVRKPGQWERLVSAVKAPEGAANAVILLVADKIPEGERAWFDDVTFVLAD
jgi:hypothetical protein